MQHPVEPAEAFATHGPRPGYRPCIGIFLLDPRNRVFIGRRAGMPEDGWQMPQGGIDEGETPEIAGLREMREEIGTDRATLLRRFDGWLSYDLPPAIAGTLWGGRYCGQTQLWIAYRFTGRDSDIRLDTHQREFDAWRWAVPETVADLIVPFKRPVYRRVVEEFRPLWSG
jgi:putative (di)nucleoside polyphosphate hydrolase